MSPNSQTLLLCALATVLIGVSVVTGQDCRAGTRYFKQTGRCYAAFYNLSGTVTKYRQFCKDQGMQLTSIKSAKENKFIFEMIKTPGLYALEAIDNLAIGMHYLMSDFVWDDAEEIVYTNWREGYPSTESDLNCVFMVAGLKNSGQWMNYDCSKPIRGAICYMNA